MSQRKRRRTVDNLSDAEKALWTAINLAGGPLAVADLFGITPQAVSQWKICPGPRVVGMEEACGGVVSRHQLRPDTFPDEPADAPIMPSAAAPYRAPRV